MPSSRGSTLAALAGIALLAAPAARAQSAADLAGLSLEQLGDVQVTSVSKRSEAIGGAASAVFVISRDDIVRSGAATLPEMLRLAPNLQVAQTSASRYVITARGFNGAPAAQNFANKLLVLIDGRSVYTPTFSGVYWDMQDVLPQDIDRIEVISGPGATLWGANAVNGVINVITRTSGETLGAVLNVGAGDQDRSAALRLGGRLGDNLTARLYAKTFLQEDTFVAGTDRRTRDHWSKPQVGFRLDWTPSEADALTLQGDAYRGDESQPAAPAETIRGGNLTGRWSHDFGAGGSLQVQAYYDHARRSTPVDGSGFRVDTYDLDVQHSFSLGERQQLVVGGGYRRVDYAIDGSQTLQWSPPARRLSSTNIFVQDTVRLARTLTATAGVKLENDAFVDAVLLPSLRLSFTPDPSWTLWGAVSRAVRAPTPFDRDVVEVVGGAPFLVGGSGFRSETLTASELGVKLFPGAGASLSVTAFRHDYDRLRSIEVTPVTFVPLYWGNGIEGHSYGLEAWGELQAAPWWRLSGGMTWTDQKFRFKPGASGLLGLSQVANDPKYQVQLRSSMTFAPSWTADAWLRYVSPFPEPRLRAYTELNARIGRDLSEKVRLSVSGRNLLHDRHREYVDGNDIPRAVYVDLQWRF